MVRWTEPSSQNDSLWMNILTQIIKNVLKGLNNNKNICKLLFCLAEKNFCLIYFAKIFIENVHCCGFALCYRLKNVKKHSLKKIA
jgi:hypothetical protein